MCDLCCYCHMSRCHGAPRHVFTPPLTTGYCLHRALVTARPTLTLNTRHWAILGYSDPAIRQIISPKSLLISLYLFIKRRWLADQMFLVILKRLNQQIINKSLKRLTDCYWLTLQNTDRCHLLHNMYVFSLPVKFYLTRVYLPVPECGKGPGPGWEPDWVTDMISLMDYTRLLDSGAFINFMIENIYNKVEKMIPCNLFLTTRRGLGKFWIWGI